MQQTSQLPLPMTAFTQFRQPPSQKLLSFDLEIVKPIPEGETDWKRHRPLGISCASTAQPGEEPILWHPGKARGIVPGCEGGQMDSWDLAHLVSFFLKKQADGYTIYTWNGAGFDFDVLAEESGLLAECRQLCVAHVDMMFHFFCIKGFPLGLDAAARGCGLPGKPEGMNGALAPVLWAGTFADRQRVLSYVANDALTTLHVAQEVLHAGQLSWTSKSGRPNTCLFPTGFLPVGKARQLSYPDVSWMSNPMTRHSLVGWCFPEDRDEK